MNYELDPELDQDIQKFGKWLQKETEKQKQDVLRVITLNLCGYAVVMILVVCMTLYFPMSDRAALLIVMATCAFCMVYALFTAMKALLLSEFNISMNIRWLGTMLHDIRKISK